MKLLLLTNKKPNQLALIDKLSEKAELGVVFSKNISKTKPSLLARISNSLITRTAARPLHEAWSKMQEHYRNNLSSSSNYEILNVDNINDPAVLSFANEFNPQLTLVSGTNLLSEATIGALQEFGPVLNLHTGISPYIKGGPNCTNWCLAIDKFYLIGNTVMYINPGIDTGKIIITEQSPLSGKESLFELHLAVMDHAHKLYLEVVKSFASGKSPLGIEQDSLGRGEVFYSKQWNWLNMRRAIHNFRSKFKPEYFSSSNYLDDTAQLKLVTFTTKDTART